MSNKAAILERIQRQLEPNGSREKRKNLISQRLEAKLRGVTPKFASSKAKLIARFVDEAIKAEASVETVSSKNIAKAITNYLRDHNLPAELRMGNDKRLASIRDRLKKTIKIMHGPSEGSDMAGLSHAECGVSETGTLGLLSGPDNPTTINFLPENHIVVLNQNDVVAHYEDLWDRIRSSYGVGKMPRTVNLVTGPSRSADIEQTLILGAHGPVRLHIILVRD